ncbi:hypothetical protein BXZ70DRAFT_658584 [Cristinia sonorae]|uniref:Uncharacterized protein n=1 Tax=Cristinia sonorae TaxID=1940300 RepID=A0A8K0UDN4_9AGAR|nr:hypothetical protein BXZ70DRAFT_658584 [Cristinia sonorae]
MITRVLLSMRINSLSSLSEPCTVRYVHRSSRHCEKCLINGKKRGEYLLAFLAYVLSCMSTRSPCTFRQRRILELKHPAQSCDPATFVLDGKDAVDEPGVDSSFRGEADGRTGPGRNGREALAERGLEMYSKFFLFTEAFLPANMYAKAIIRSSNPIKASLTARRFDTLDLIFPTKYTGGSLILRE